MLKRFFGFLFGRSLDSVLNETKKVKIKGIRFTLRKVNLLDHLNGSKVMMQIYDTYKVSNAPPVSEAHDKKIKEHFSHVLVSGVVSPKLSFNEGGDGLHVEKMFDDWEIVDALYAEITALTYGKKKLKQSLLLEQNLKKSIT